jgi:hypothetical protein
MLKLLIDTCAWLDQAKDYDRRDMLLSHCFLYQQ